MGFELFYKNTERANLKSLQNENITLSKSGVIIISEKVMEKLNVKLEKFYFIYIDKKLGRIGIKFTKENNLKSSRKVTMHKNSTTAHLFVSSALKNIGVNNIEMKESFKPFMINDVIVLDVKHLIKKSDG